MSVSVCMHAYLCVYGGVLEDHASSRGQGDFVPFRVCNISKPLIPHHPMARNSTEAAIPICLMMLFSSDLWFRETSTTWHGVPAHPPFHIPHTAPYMSSPFCLDFSGLQNPISSLSSLLGTREDQAWQGVGVALHAPTNLTSGFSPRCMVLSMGPQKELCSHKLGMTRQGM